MANYYNHRKDEDKFMKEWEEKKKDMKDAGMDKDQIDLMYLFDREVFNSNRRYYERLDDDQLDIEEYSSGKIKPADTIDGFINSLESIALVETLSELDFETKLIVFLIYRGYEVSDVSKITGISLWAIYRRIKKLRKTYSSHKNKKIQ